MKKIPFIQSLRIITLLMIEANLSQFDYFFNQILTFFIIIFSYILLRLNSKFILSDLLLFQIRIFFFSENFEHLVFFIGSVNHVVFLFYLVFLISVFSVFYNNIFALISSPNFILNFFFLI